MFKPSDTSKPHAEPTAMSDFVKDLPDHLKSQSERAQAEDKFRFTDHHAHQLHIGIVQASFNHEVTNALKEACLQELLDQGLSRDRLVLIEVPGALEIPIALQTLAQIKEPQPFHALIALGCIIRGETYHFELVANESAAGLNRVSLDFHIPIVNAILTTEDLAQAQARQTIKGQEAALAALDMIKVLESWE